MKILETEDEKVLLRYMDLEETDALLSAHRKHGMDFNKIADEMGN